ncbi:casein kinase II subunit alpha-like protein [Tanacetum coccineum]
MDSRSFNIFAKTAYDCLNERRSRRPNINKIVTRLEKALEHSENAIFRKEPFFYGHDNYDQLVKISKVLGSDELNTYLQRYHLEQDPHLVALEPWTKFINSDNQHLAVFEAVDFLDKLLRYDHQERPPTKEAMHNQRQFGHSHSPNFVNPVRIIKKNNTLSQNDEDIEIDIDSVDIETLWELDRYVTNYRKNLSKVRRRAEIQQARALAGNDTIQV